MADDTGYIVAFRGTKAKRGYEGIVTHWIWNTKEEFDEWRNSLKGIEELKVKQILEEGITGERAIELGKSTPIESRIMFAMVEATDSKTGVLDEGRMGFVARKAAAVIRYSLGLE